ncbi:MAG: hypothetical protein QOK21_4234 [Solirubrobacteraceae bacterium]|jgi:hypothetical protein|nr:hypothetical protein [Solirubrobacteraceae bacterium]
MAPDEELVVIFAILHLVALMLGGALFALFLRSDSRARPDGPDDDESDGGGGGNDRISDKPKTSPSGGIPLPDAEPAPVRLRGHERLSDLRPRPLRRPAREPQRSPVRRRVGA